MTVSMQGRVRGTHAGGLSAREVSRRLGVSRNTVAKYLAKQDFSPPPPAAPERAQPAMEGCRGDRGVVAGGGRLRPAQAAPHRQARVGAAARRGGPRRALPAAERLVRRWCVLSSSFEQDVHRKLSGSRS